MRRIAAFDMSLFLCVLILVGLGIACVYTASYPKALALTETGGDSFFYAGKQIKNVLVGLVAMMAFTYLPLGIFYRHPRRDAFFWGLVTVVGVMLLAVLVLGQSKHGNKSWVMGIQPSEFAKVGIVLTLSAYLARNPWMVKTMRSLFAGPVWFLFIPAALIMGQKDLGTTLMVVLATMIMLMIAGTKARYIGILLAVLALPMFGLILVKPRTAERFRAWAQPENRTIIASDQPRNSLIAIGSGGLLGRGFCQSRQKWFYLPASQNDSIFAVIAEEFGFFLTVLLLFCPYLFLIFRGFSIAHGAPDEFHTLVAMGSTVMIATQALINLGMAMNLLPTIGINLPFISYGGSSIIASMMMAGLLLNVSTLRSATATRPETAPGDAMQPAMS